MTAGAEVHHQGGTEATRALVSVAHGEMTGTTHLQPAAGWVLWAAERVPAVLPDCLISFLKLFMGPLIRARCCLLHLVTSPSADSPVLMQVYADPPRQTSLVRRSLLESPL